MELTGFSGAAAPGRPIAREGRGPMLASDFQTFLQMLTAQMRNQDPLNPLQASDFAVQLATFSGVEQAVRTNQLLEALMAQSAVAELAGLVGMTARAPVPAQFDGNGTSLSLPSFPQADSATLLVRNAFGQVVDSVEVPPGGGTMTWRGLGPDGTPLPQGVYSFEVAGFIGGAFFDSRPAETYAPVIEARRDNGMTMLVLAGNIEIPLGDVTALRAPGTL